MLKSAQFIMESSSSFSSLNAMSRNKSSCTELEISDNETDKVDSFFHRCLSFSQSVRNSAVSVFRSQSHKNCNWYCQRDQASPIRRPYHPVSTASQSRTVNKLDILAASPHRTLNTCKGVIKCAPLIDCDRDKHLKNWSHKASMTSSTSLSKTTQEVVEARTPSSLLSALLLFHNTSQLATSF